MIKYDMTNYAAIAFFACLFFELKIRNIFWQTANGCSKAVCFIINKMLSFVLNIIYSFLERKIITTI